MSAIILTKMSGLYLIIVFSMFNFVLTEELRGRVVFAHILFRHGDRTPVDPYPTDPWNNLKYWPTGWGQLTNLGKMQHYRLGEWLKTRYSSIVNDTYSKDEIYIQSTDVDRTLMSASSNLAGFYPPHEKQIWNKNISWQPIPVHTIPETQDSVLAAKKTCPAYEFALRRLRQSDEFKKLDNQYKYLYDYLSKHTGKTIKSLENVEKIYNTLYIEQLYNKSLPEWTKKVYPNGDMKHISDLSFATSTYTRKLAKLKSGPILKEILNRFKTKFNGKLKPNRSVWIYSGHDTTVANILNTLKLFEFHSPPYAACVILELRIYNNTPLVSVLYRNSSEEPQPLNIPNCGIQCTLNDMFTLYNDVIPINWESECMQTLLSMSFENNEIGFLIAFLIIPAVIAFTLLAAAICYYRRNRSYSRYFYVQLE